MGHWIGFTIGIILLAAIGFVMVMWVWTVASTFWRALFDRPDKPGGAGGIGQDSAGL